jgi:DNA-binding CsgD family transcriptional regulator
VQARQVNPSAGIFGREAELAILHDFVQAAGQRALVLSGGPGIGKTTLWQAGIGAARERRLRVLSARASGAEAQLAFAALIDLLDTVDADDLSALPAPQRRALEVALLRAEPKGAPPEPRAISLGFRNALRVLAKDGPVLIGVDDVQWLDPPSLEAVAFAVRRVEGDIGLLLAQRPGRLSRFERALELWRPQRLEIGPLSLGAVRRLLSERLGLSLPRQLLRRLMDSTLGNPLFALELGRLLAEHGLPAIGEELPVPDTIEDLLGTRVGQLPQPLRRVLLVVALSAGLGTAELAALTDPAAIDEAVNAGLLVLEGDRVVRAAHPLLAAAAKKRSRVAERRELHHQLAQVTSDGELRAKHLALAAERPNAELASAVAAAGASASARGAREEAVELAEHALRLTPADAEARTERLLALAQYLDAAGQLRRVTTLLVPEVEQLPAGPARARAYFLLASDASHASEFEGHLDRAYRESESDPQLRASILATKSAGVAVGLVERISDAEAWALDAVSLGRALPDGSVDPAALEALAWTRILTGRGVDDLDEPSSGLPDASVEVFHSVARVAGIQHAFRGEVDEARDVLARLLALADERGEGWSYYALRLQLCELELRAGRWQSAEELLEEWEPSPDEGIQSASSYARCRALLEAGRGFSDRADRLAAEAITLTEKLGIRWDRLEGLRARGIAASLAHEPARALESLRSVWDHMAREGVEEPGAFPVAPELVEALVELGELGEARAVTDRLQELSQQQNHPWGLATTKRCDGVVGLASGFDEQAVEALEQAAADYETLGLRFDRARSLLVLGRAQRRHRKWAAARRSLERAAAAFDALGSPGWAVEAHSELARVGARRSQPTGELTPTERRVVELAADGLSNKEIAGALFVSVHTVEAHLTHAYAKLGIRSRTQLARRLSTL